MLAEPREADSVNQPGRLGLSETIRRPVWSMKKDTHQPCAMERRKGQVRNYLLCRIRAVVRRTVRASIVGSGVSGSHSWAAWFE